MSEHPYFQFFKGQGSISDLGNKKPFYNYIKSLFFDYYNSKWIDKKYLDFINENELNYTESYKILENIWYLYLKDEPKNTGFKYFLKRIKKLNEIDKSLKIPLDGLRNKVALGEIFYILQEYTTGSKEAIINLMSDELYTGYTKSTLRSYFFDKKFKRKPSKKSPM